MKTPGIVLREQREKKSYTQQRVASETNISLQYIIALEDDMFNQFPGEPYLLGYLKTYAEYLGISQDTILAIYENYKLAEAPIPMHELMSREPFKIPGWLIGLTLSLLLAIGLAWFLIPYVQKKYEEHQRKIIEQKEVKNTEKGIHVITEEDYTGVLHINDVIQVSFGDSTYNFVPVKMEGSETVFHQYYNNEEEVTEFSISLGEESFFSLGGSSQANFLIRITDIGLEDGKAVSFVAQKLTNFKNQQRVTERPQLKPIPENLANMTAEDNYAGKRRTVLSMRSPIRVEINITFTGNSNFRYLLDGRESHERYYQEGERLQRSMNTSFRLWTANAGKTRLKIGLHEVTLGKDGEVVVKVLRWVYNSRTGGYDLILEDYV